jgi:hypothetical protein
MDERLFNTSASEEFLVSFKKSFPAIKFTEKKSAMMLFLHKLKFQ